MKRLLTFASVVALAATALVLVQCDALLGGAPGNITIAAATDSTVQISWTAPTEGTPDKYLVYFMAVDANSYTQVDETSATVYVHDPMGKTGRYKVEAQFGSDTYAGSTNPTSVPAENATMTVAELNAAGNAGYGWDMTDGDAATYSMTNAGTAPNVDLYITDFALGYAGPTYSVASPDMAESDPGNAGVVPNAAWKVNSFSNPVANEDGPLPMHSQTTYFNYTDISTEPMLLGAYTEEGYYAMVKTGSVNTASGEVPVESWFQLVQGLRLIQH
jgi:hypothetical protein